jgi:S-DNA-T family DNA segregation ATPase FtsK/SpoIIIE
VACTQKPTAAVIGGLVKSNFPVRIVGSVSSPEDAKVATGIGGTGAERLLGQGDFLVVAQGQVTRMQAAYVSVQQVRELVRSLGSGARPLRLVATGTDGASSHASRPRSASLAERLKEQMRRIK